MATNEDDGQQRKPSLVLVDPATVMDAPAEQVVVNQPEAVAVSSIPTSATTTDLDEDDNAGKGGSHSDDNSSAEEQTPAKKKPFKPRTTKGLVEDTKTRTSAAKKRGNSLVNAAKAFAERTGGQVFVKAKYSSDARKKPYVFEFGKDFPLPTEEVRDAASPTSPKTVDTEALKTAVEEGFMGALDKLEKGSPLPGSSGIPTSQNLFGSPSAPASAVVPRRRSASNAGCIVCSTDDINIDVKGQIVEADWFYCSKVGCRAKAHNECVGFPGVKFATIGGIAKWYCRLHVGQGRPLPSNLDEVSVAPVATAAAAKAQPQNPAGKGNQGGEQKRPRGRPPKKT